MAALAKSSSYGRPRLLSHEEILRGAVALGLENLTMKKLAVYLGVGTATLYQYFDSRKALLQAAVTYALSETPLPEDVGQHWSALAREYVECFQSLLIENPAYIQNYQHTEYGFEVQFKLIEPFLQSMNERGFSAEEGMHLYYIVGAAAFAGSIELLRQREFELRNEKLKNVAHGHLSKLGVTNFPLLSEGFDAFTSSPQSKTEAYLSLAFRSLARERGENDAELFGSTGR